MQNLKHRVDDINETQVRVGTATVDKEDEPQKTEITEENSKIA